MPFYACRNSGSVVVVVLRTVNNHSGMCDSGAGTDTQPPARHREPVALAIRSPALPVE